MVVNDYAFLQNEHGAIETIAGKPVSLPHWFCVATYAALAANFS